MMDIDELISDDPFIELFEEHLETCKNHVKVLPPSNSNSEILLNVQVPTKSILGSLIYYTGGVVVDHGWVRLLGSGSDKIPRNLYEWNIDSKGVYFVGDDAAGGFFAINGGSFPGELGIIHYWAPDSMEWESLGLKYSDFLLWLINKDLDQFYDGIRWKNWKEDTAHISTDKCYDFYPPLWSKEGDCDKSYKGVVPIAEVLALKHDLQKQFSTA